MENLFDHLKLLPPVERLHRLEANADEIKTGSYFHDFTPEEMEDLKNSNTQNDIELLGLQEERKRLLEPIDRRIKEIKTAKNYTVKNIKEGREERHGKIYLFNDDESGRTYELTEEATVIREYPNIKRQGSIYQEIRKTG